MRDNATVRLALYFARTYPGRTLLMVALLLLAGMAEGIGLITMLPVLELAAGMDGPASSQISQAIQDVLGTVGLAPNLGLLLTLIVVALAAKALLTWFAMRQVGYVVTQVATDLRLRLIRALLKARWRHFAAHPSGHFATAVSSEAQRAAAAYKDGCTLIAGMIQVGVYTLIVLLISWQLALVALAVGLVVVFLMRSFVQSVRQAGREQTESMRRLIWRLTDVLPGMKSVKAMARERFFLPLLEEEAQDYNQAQRTKVMATEGLKALREPVLAIFVALAMFLILTWGNQPFPAVLVMVFLFYRVTSHINGLQTKYQSLVSEESAFEAMHDSIDRAEAEEEQHPGTLPAPPVEQGIRFDKVSFAYGDTPVLEDVDLFVPAGHFVALVGNSGAGKTTIADLVAGLHLPTGGTLYVDGLPLDSINTTSWRSQLGYVPQDTLLFDGSIYRNVTLGDESFSREDVRRALEEAGAWGFVSALPGTMDSEVGQQGLKISGGQRQRIAIARALLTRPRILILDEATTALDPDTEAAICETLRRLRGKVTVLAVSHQPAIRDVADLVYEVAGGQVREVRRSRTAALLVNP
jgi:ATP-binding cassette, subfamily C, bacterial